MNRRVIGTREQFPDDSRKVVEVDGVEIAVFNVGGDLHAIRNACPHKGAPLCTHAPTGMMMPSDPDVYDWDRDNEVVRCPWHGYEFDLADGRPVLAPQLKLRARVYKIAVEGEEIALYA